MIQQNQPQAMPMAIRPTAATERHLTVDEIATNWGLSRDTIRRLFMPEDGVMKIVRPGTRCKRTHTTLRIPESVMERVHRRMCAKAA
jgi:transcriptional regulator GlxA family with amidase domain